MSGGNFPSNNDCRATRRTNPARNRTAGNTLLKRIVSNLYIINIVALGWPFSWNTEIKVTSAELASLTTGPVRLMWSGPYCELYCHAVCTGESFGICCFGAWFVYERIRVNLINPRVLKIIVRNAVCSWRCWTRLYLIVHTSDHEWPRGTSENEWEFAKTRYFYYNDIIKIKTL